MTQSICSRLDTYLKLCSQQDFTGVFEISNEHGTSWKLRYLSGYLVADSGGMFPVQRLQRQLARYRLDVSLEDFCSMRGERWNHGIIKRLVDKHIISKKKAAKILGSSACEILFEAALQELNQTDGCVVNNYQMTWQSEESFRDVPAVSLDMYKIWGNVKTLVEKWDGMGWRDISPCSVPVVTNLARLKELTRGTQHGELPNILDDSQCLWEDKHWTLWELASRLRCSIYSITQTMMDLEQHNCVRMAGFTGLSGELFIHELYPTVGIGDIPTLIAM